VKNDKTSIQSGWLSRLAQFYRKNRLRLFGAIVFTLLSAVSSLLLPLILSFVIDSVIDTRPASLPVFIETVYTQLGGRAFLLPRLYFLGILILMIVLLDGFFQFFRGKWIAIYAEDGSRRMRETLFSHLQRLPFAYHARAETGDLIQRCTSDVDTIKRFVGTQLLEIFRSFSLVAASATVMFLLDPTMALIGMAVTPIIFVTSLMYFRKERLAFQKWDEAEGALSTMLQESLTGVRVVKAFARQAFEREKFDEKNSDLRNFGWKTFQIIANFWMFSDFICLLQIMVVTLVGSIFTISGRLTLGQMIIFISYTEMLLFPLRNLARMLADAGKMHISFGRLKEILDEEPEPDDSHLQTPVLKGRIEFRHVDFAYDVLQRPVLSDLSFRIASGETVGIIGPTGSGKSTLLYLLQRLYDPTAGVILLDGMDLREMQRETVRRSVGLILQEPFVFSRSIFENIRLPRPDASVDDVSDAARTAALHDDVMRFESGYETVVGERGVTLSGGQKQRLTIARTLIRECPILVFDDSLSAVDTETDAQIRYELKARKNKTTTLIVSHRISTLSEADRIFVIENGRITAVGTHQELIGKPGLYQRVYQIQNTLAEEVSS
jgi:ATP-binding cassette subfamily B protein